MISTQSPPQNTSKRSLTFNKSLCKEEVEKFGIITPKSILFKLGDLKNISSH